MVIILALRVMVSVEVGWPAGHNSNLVLDILRGLETPTNIELEALEENCLL